MIRVLHITGTMNRGGIETFLMNVYRKLDKNLIQFDFLVHTNEKCDYHDEIISLGGRVFNIPSRRQGIIKNRIAINEFFDKHQEYKIIHQHVSSLSYITPLKIAKKKNIPVRIIHSHNINEGRNFLHHYIHKLNKIYIDTLATSYFACSELAAKWLFNKKIMKNMTYQIIHNAIDLSNFKYDTRLRETMRHELHLENDLVIGHIGRFVYQKNHVFLLEIFREINLKIPNSKLVLVGDGPLKNEIIQKITEYDLKDKVIMTGVRKDIPEILNSLDVFVLPSRFEGLGIVLIEAQATGLKCYTSDTVVPREVAITNLVNFVGLENDSKKWSEKILADLNYERSNTVDEIKNAGYDINQLASYLEKWYLNQNVL